MRICRNCGIKIADDGNVCPLCRCVTAPCGPAGDDESPDLPTQKGVVSDTPIYPYLNAEREIRKMQRALRIYLAAAIAAVVILILADIAVHGTPGWVILIGIFLAYGYLTLKVSISMHTGYRLIVFLQCVLGVAVLFAIDMVSGFQGWSLTYVIPAACMLIDLAIVVMMIVNKRDWQSYIPFLLVILAFSILPLVLFSFGLVTHLVVPVIGLTLVALTFAGAVIVGGRRARDELYRRFRA